MLKARVTTSGVGIGTVWAIVTLGSIAGCGFGPGGAAPSTVACDFAPAENLDEIRQTYELFRDSGGTMDEALSDQDSNPAALCAQSVALVVEASDETLSATERAGLQEECESCLTAIIEDVFGG
ncbi:MAG: hypothetical protein HOP29_07740 [Phycisphaerales bacterium]|nr:hypothetical protein [Phycisphaerales bacterium]